MLAEKNGAAEVVVIEGSVEASGRDSLNQPAKTITLKEKQARRYSLHGDQKLAKLNRKVEFQRGMGKTEYTHWSFVEASGAIARSRSVGFDPGGFDATFEPALPKPLVAGRWGNALSFDGAFSARATFPPRSPSGTRTAAFRCKIPADAALSESDAIISWYSAETGERPVSIAWNGDPTLGALGALKTSLGRGLKVGSTPLRDGQWHHEAVVFAPNPDAPARPHLKTYLDGRLEATSFVRRHREELEKGRGRGRPLCGRERSLDWTQPLSRPPAEWVPRGTRRTLSHQPSAEPSGDPAFAQEKPAALRGDARRPKKNPGPAAD